LNRGIKGTKKLKGLTVVKLTLIPNPIVHALEGGSDPRSVLQ